MSTSVSRPAGWALHLPRSSAKDLLGLRLVAGIEVTETADTIWLRGRQRDDALDRLLSAIPAEKRYAWLDGHRLQPNGSRLASERLPETPWQSLSAWIPVRLPVAQLPGPTVAPASLQLVRDFQPQAANAALVNLAVWTDWASTAPALRLAPLHFAASNEGLCLVVGEPLPAIPSRPLIEKEGVIVPAGFNWRPRVTSKVIRRLLGASDDCRIFWDEAGVRLLSSELFVPASRAAAHATTENHAS